MQDVEVSGPGDNFTVKEIVIDIRDTVYKLAEKVDRMDEQSSRARVQIETNTRAIGDLDKQVALLAERPVVTRQEIHNLKGDIGALKTWQTVADALLKDKGTRLNLRLALLATLVPLAVAAATTWLTYYWINHG